MLASLAFSRIFFIGSDLENLLITGVSRWRLSVGIFLFLVLLASPMILIFDRGLLIIPLAFEVPQPIFNSATLMLYLLFIFLTMLSLTLGVDRSTVAVLFVSLLDFSNLVGNPFSIGSIDSAQFAWGFVALSAVIFILLATLLVSIQREGYAPYRMSRKRKKELVRSPMDFSGIEPHKSSFRLGLSLSFSSVVNNTSPRGPRSARIRTSRALLALLSFNVILALLIVFLFHSSIGSTNGAPGDLLIMLSSFYTSLVLWTFVSISFSQERLWLLGSTIGGRLFLINHIKSKASLFSILMLPSIIPVLAMALIGHPLFLRFGFFVAVTQVILAFPSAALALYISGFLLPEQYIRSEMPASGSLNFLVIAMPVIFSIVAGIVSYFNAWFLLASALVMYSLVLAFLSSPRFNDRVFNDMVSRRFI